MDKIKEILVKIEDVVKQIEKNGETDELKTIKSLLVQASNLIEQEKNKKRQPDPLPKTRMGNF